MRKQMNRAEFKLRTEGLVKIPPEGLDIMFDCDLMRPGCVLLQAGGGCLSTLAHVFPTSSWILAPTPGLKKYHLDNQKQLEALLMRVEQGLENEQS